MPSLDTLISAGVGCEALDSLEYLSFFAYINLRGGASGHADGCLIPQNSIHAERDGCEL